MSTAGAEPAIPELEAALAPPQLVHLGTMVEAHFALVDAEGNAVAQPPISAQLSRFAPGEFQAAYDGIKAQRDQELATLNAPAPPPPNRAARRAKPVKRTAT